MGFREAAELHGNYALWGRNSFPSLAARDTVLNRITYGRTRGLHRYAYPLDWSHEAEIRAYVLQHLPVGSSWDAVQRYCDQNFEVSKIEKRAPGTAPEESLKKAYVYIHAYSADRFPVSSAHLNFIFVLDSNDYLGDVIADCDAVSL